MGWTFTEELMHLRTYAGQQTAGLRAHTYLWHQSEVDEWIAKAMENEFTDSLGIFYIAKSGIPQQPDQDYIGLLLIDFMREGADEKTARAGQSVWAADSDIPIPVEHPLVQQWGHKVIPASAGPTRLDCPIEWLDQVPPGDGDIENRWREKVRIAKEYDWV